MVNITKILHYIPSIKFIDLSQNPNLNCSSIKVSKRLVKIKSKCTKTTVKPTTSKLTTTTSLTTMKTSTPTTLRSKTSNSYKPTTLIMSVMSREEKKDPKEASNKLHLYIIIGILSLIVILLIIHCIWLKLKPSRRPIEPTFPLSVRAPSHLFSMNSLSSGETTL